MKLQAKIILVLAPIVAAPLIALGWVAYTQQRDSLEHETKLQMETLLLQIDRLAQARFSAARANARLFSNANTTQRYLLIDDESQRYRMFQPSLLKLFASYQRAYPEYYEIRILLPDGYEDTRATTWQVPNRREEEADTLYFTRMLEAEDDTLIQVLVNPDTETPVAMISQRIALLDPSIDPILAKAKLRGFLVVTMDLEFLREQANDDEIGRGGHIFFVDSKSRVLIAPSSVHHGEMRSAPEIAGFREALASGAVVRGTHLGESFLLRASPIHDNLNMVVAFPEAGLLERTRRVALVAVGLTIASILITATLVFMVLRALVLRPVAKLGHAAQEIGRGNLSTDIDLARSDELGELAGSFHEMRDSLRSSHEQIAFLAYHDSLTGLPNRRLFAELLERAAGQGLRKREVTAILFLDLDDFKKINDTHGHQVGDGFLREVADRLSDEVRPYDCVSRPATTVNNTVARLGGDEFIVLLPGLANPMQAATVAGRFLQRLATPVVVEGSALQVKASIGIATAPQDGNDADTLIKNADIAMYHAKDRGKNHYQFYTDEMNTALIERMTMEGALREAIANGDFLLHYQPQILVATGELVGMEALIRWQHAELGMVSPGAFIPLAEETGLIVEIGDWVLGEACRQNKAWQDAGLAPVPVSINISNRQFSRTDLEQEIGRVLRETGLEPHYLDVELTETSIMDAPDRAIETLDAVKALGVRLSMDDFGTGYSSLGMLKRLPIDCLKIDQSFIRDLSADGHDVAIISTIIAMGRSLDLMVLAEGVETEEQLAFLRTEGCDRMQGYLVSRPVPAADMEMLLGTGGSLFSPGTEGAANPGAISDDKALRLVH